jgi:cell division septation protein DedD
VRPAPAADDERQRTTETPPQESAMPSKRISLAAGAAAALLVTGVAVATIGSADAAGALTATVSRSTWDSGYTATYTIDNGTTAVVPAWTVEFDLPAGTTVGAYWDALISTSGTHVVAKNREYNNNVKPGGKVTFGFVASGTQEPANCKVNGAPCTGGTPPTTSPTTSPTPTPTKTPTPFPPTPSPTKSPSASPSPTKSPDPGGVNLDDPRKKDIAMQLVSSAENSSLDWKAQYAYIEDIGDGRGYTAGIIGFCSGTGDMVELVELYAQRKPGNILAKYLPALHNVDGSDSHAGLDPNYPADWRTAAKDPVFQQAQNDERDRVYFNPSVAQGKSDKLRALGQFAYYDAAVMHGYDGFAQIRKRAMARAKTPAQGGSETTYLNAFLDERVIEMKKEEAHSDTSRVDTAQRVFLQNGNLDLNTPLVWHVYGEEFHIN